MSSREEHEQGLALFLAGNRRVRFRESLAGAGQRRKLQRKFAHFEDWLDPRFAQYQEQHAKHDAHVAEVHDRLVAIGAPGLCFLLWDEDRLADALPLRDALEELMWSGSGLLSCLPGRLGLYVGEDGSNVYILRRAD